MLLLLFLVSLSLSLSTYRYVPSPSPSPPPPNLVAPLTEFPSLSCKAEGRSETQAGSAQADAACGPPLSSKENHITLWGERILYSYSSQPSDVILPVGAAPSWVIVSVLSAITVLCLLILFLFCYKDKLKLLSCKRQLDMIWLI